MVFRFGLNVQCQCAKCERARDVPDGEVIAQGDTMLVVRDSVKCLQCGDDRVVVRARVEMK